MAMKGALSGARSIFTDILEHEAKQGGKKVAKTATKAAGKTAAKAARSNYIREAGMGGGLMGTMANMASPMPTKAAVSGMKTIAGATTKTAAGSALMQSGLGSSVKRATKAMGKNLSDTGWDMAKSDVARRAVRGAATGAAVGAGVSIAQGEDVWEGAGRGMMVGGTIGAGVSGVRMATATDKNQNVFQGASAFANKTGVSRSVEALGKMASASRNSPTRKNPLTGAKISRWR